MPKIEITNISGSQFMSLKNNFKLDNDSFKPGLYLFDGPVGAGKSSLAVEAISYGLFGKTVRDLSYANEIISRDTDAAVAAIEIGFRVDGTRYHVLRTRSANSTHLCFFSDYLLNRSPLTQSSVAETQAKIEEILGMDWKLFCSSFVFGQSSHFKFSSLGNKERRLVLESALGVDIYREASKKARESARLFLDQIEKYKQLEKAAIQQELGASTRLARLETSLEGVNEKRRGIRESLKKLEAEIAAFPDDYLQRKNDTELQRKLERMSSEAEERLGELEIDQAWDKKERDKLRNLHRESECPTCGQKIVDRTCDDKIASRQKIKELGEQISRTEKRIGIARAKAVDYAQFLKEVEERLVESSKRLNERHVLEARTTGLEEALSAIDTESLKEDINEEKFARKAAIAQIQAHKEKLITLRSDFATCKYLVEALGDQGIATALIENAMPVLAKTADEVSIELGSHVEPVFAATREKDGKIFNEVTLSAKNRGEDVSYVSNSGGEKSLLDFTAGIAVQELVSGNHPLNLAVFDEALDHLDRESGEAVVRYLEKLAEKKAVWLISHKDWVKDVATFRKVFTVTHDGTQSVIEEN